MVAGQCLETESLEEIIEKYKSAARQDAKLFGLLQGVGFVTFLIIAGFVAITFEDMPEDSLLDRAFSLIRFILFSPSPEGYSYNALVSWRAVVTYLSIGGGVAVLSARDNMAQAVKELDRLKDRASQFPSEDSVTSVIHMLSGKHRLFTRQATAELLSYAGDCGKAALIEFLSPSLSSDDLEVAAVAAHSLACVGSYSAQEHLQKCALEADGLLKRLLEVEPDKSKHSSITAKAKRYKDAVQQSLEWNTNRANSA